MSVKECENHGKQRRKIYRRIIGCILVFSLIVLITILLIWAILRPSKPSFILEDTTVYAFNASIPNFLTSSFQVTISSKNPNDRIGIYYDRMSVFATYGNQQVTLSTALPPTYQGSNEVNVWSPFVYGNMVPIAPFFFQALNADQNAGSVFMMIKIDGQVRWKVGTFISGRYHLFVNCPAFLSFGNSGNGVVVGANAVKFQYLARCSVNV